MPIARSKVAKYRNSSSSRSSLPNNGEGTKVAFEIFTNLLAFFGPLKVLRMLQDLEKGKALFDRLGDEPIEGRNPLSEMLGIFDRL